MLNEYLSDWDFVLSFLPEGWRDKFAELKLLKFGRKFSGKEKEERLFRVLMMHLADGLSLRTTSEQARLGGLAEISDVGILARLRKSASWFSWCSNELMRKHFNFSRDIAPESGLRFMAVDASTVKEPGATGSLWRLHYAMNLFTLSPAEILLSDCRKGESFCNFKIGKGDLFFGDRAYARAAGIAHVVNGGGHVLCRFSPHLLPLLNTDNAAPFALLPKLRKLAHGESGCWRVQVHHGEQSIKGRVCAMKKTPLAAAKAKDEICREATKKQRTVSERTLEFAEYVLIFTTLPAEEYSDDFVLRTYRLRWQIELFFKRLKSVLDIGHLPKYDTECAKAYLCGKIFIALLIEAMIRSAEDFFP